MKISVNKQIKAAGFTLIEMIGVLAVIAILASLLIPKIFNAINDAKVNNTVLSYNTVRTAVMDHYGKYGSFTSLFGTNAATAAQLTNFASVLLTESIIDKPFLTKLGTGSYIQVLQTANIPNYDLDGDAVNDVTTANSTILVEALITEVEYLDAKDVNDRLDGAGPPFTFGPNATTSDSKGRVKWDHTTKALNIYIAHR
jgi:prepilin-type N-terminal cleavage/methylation domain-containing protein